MDKDNETKTKRKERERKMRKKGRERTETRKDGIKICKGGSVPSLLSNRQRYVTRDYKKKWRKKVALMDRK